MRKVIALGKPGKDPTDANNYRPISLLSSLSKVFERILVSRVYNHLDDNDILPPEQEGFRRGRSTTHQLDRIVSHAKSALSNKQSTGLVLADVRKAFDSVWHDGLVHKMIHLQFPAHIIRLTHSFLEQRSFHVTVDGKSSPRHPIPFGVPQGSCFSPILYNVYTSDQPVLAHCNRALYTDDTALFASSSLRAKTTIPLRNAAETQINYLRKWKISISVDKTVAAFFTRRRTREIPRRPLRVNGSNVAWSAEPVKYLGLLLDKRVTLQKHITYVINKTNIAVRMLTPY